MEEQKFILEISLTPPLSEADFYGLAHELLEAAGHAILNQTNKVKPSGVGVSDLSGLLSYIGEASAFAKATQSERLQDEKAPVPKPIPPRDIKE